MKEDDEKINDTDKRIRFQKPRWALDTALENPYGCIAEAFTWIHLDDFKDELDEWLRIALINDQSAYDEGALREDVMDFCEELKVLIEALYVINEERKPAHLRQWLESLPDDLKEEKKSYNQPVLLSEEQKADPLSVIKDFYNTFSLPYARRELWDLLDSVIYYERESSTLAPDPHVTYRCLLALVEAAYVLYQFSL